MARGTPDGGIIKSAYGTQEVDPGAIYQYLWGFAPLDGKGRLEYLDTFNNGANGFMLQQQGAGLLPRITASPINSGFLFMPPYSLLLDPTSGAADVNRSRIERRFFLGVNTRLGVEIAFNKINTSPSVAAFIDYKPVDSTPYLGGIKFDNVDGKFKVWNGTTYQEIYDPGGVSSFYMWVRMKLVMDFSTGKYVRALIGDKQFDLSSISMGGTTTSYNGYATTRIDGRSIGTPTTPCELGYVLLTKDEP